mgnify:CR=1 FL=1|jgi:hypothetical protein
MYEKNNFSEVDNQLTTIVAKSATKAKVKKIIYLGVLVLKMTLYRNIYQVDKKLLNISEKTIII